jgi:hypothetical protein
MGQIRDDVIEGSALYHAVPSHGGHFRAEATTTFAANANFRFFAFVHSFGEITHTGDSTRYPDLI